MIDPDPVTQDSSEVQDKKIVPHSVRAARGLFFLIAVIWIVFGIASLIADSVDSATTVAFLMFINAAVMIFIGWGALYPDEWKRVKVEWPGHITLETLTSLRSYNRIERLGPS